MPLKKPKEAANPHLKRAFDVSNQKECKKLYDDWAASYDATLVDTLQYSAPQSVAEQLAEVVTDRSAAILDLGCGTGLVGEALTKVGFTQVDGIDFSEKMLEVARGRGVYQKLIHGDLNQRTAVEDGQYTAAISAGIFTYGHLDAGCIDEILRVIQVGGFLSSAIRLQVWEEMGFEKKFKALRSNERIETVREEKMPNYKDSTERDGLYVTFRKLA